MVGKSKAISHGINYLSYMSGESKNKKHPEKIDFICTQHMPEGLDARGVWESMQASLAGHDKLKNTLIQVELSPSQKHTVGFSRQDWADLWREFVEEFDRQTIKDKNGKVKSSQTNVAGSKAVVYLHKESKGGIPHLHGAICRVDEDGNVNNDHEIHLRAQRAAEAVARRRGWTTANEVRSTKAAEVTRLCEQVLKDMPRWSWTDYVARIEKAGYEVKARTDSKGDIKGYAIVDGKTKYKSSELGKGRSLTYSRLAATWWKLHPVTENSQEDARPVPKQSTTKPLGMANPFLLSKPRKPVEDDRRKPQPEKKKDLSRIQQPTRPDYTSWTPDSRSVDIDVEGTKHHLYLPKDVLKLFDDIFDYREVLNWQPLTNLACAYFAALLPPDIPASVGGSPTNNEGWRDKKDDDELEFARHCALMAMNKIGFQKRRGLKR
ncbi:MAG: relaxase [Prevotella sp.]|nr:relaxase [Prevotella sp.]